jgi:guanylate kinase
MMSAPLLNPLLAGHSPLPLLVVLSGPSGVGKDSVVQAMRKREFPFHFVVTMTSRAPRPGEVPGVSYHFVSPQRFEELIAQEELLEWALVYGQYKGVPKFEVRQALASGHDVVMRVNIDGAETLKRMVPEAVLIFIAPSSLNDLRQRLGERHTDTAEEIEQRLSVAQQEMDQVTMFDYVVINHTGQLDQTAAQVCTIINAEKQRVIPRRITL